MSRETINLICSELPGAEKSDPWGGGHDAWKVGGKMFACIGAATPGVSVKCADVETAAMLIDAEVAVRAPYFHKSWVQVPETVSDPDLRHRILTSYRLVRAKLPAALRMSLPALAPDPTEV